MPAAAGDAEPICLAPTEAKALPWTLRAEPE
jgi:hypothetical protein